MGTGLTGMGMDSGPRMQRMAAMMAVSVICAVVKARCGELPLVFTRLCGEPVHLLFWDMFVFFSDDVIMLSFLI